MRGVYLPGNREVDVRDVPDPTPGPGQVVVRMRASTICGSDIRAIYREHLGSGAEAYRNVIAGHEPCGEIVEAGPGCRRFGVGDRVVLYHIAGCGLCADCRSGYQISCTSPLRAAYGWQRDGGHADSLLGLRRWGRGVLVGEANRLEVDASPVLIHRQLTVHGSWVTSLGHMEELIERLVRWNLHPERVVTDRFPLEQAAGAYATADGGASG